MKTKLVSIAIVGLAATAATVLALSTLAPVSEATAAEDSGSFSKYVDEKGNITRPTDFRKNWVHLGSWFVEDNKHAKGPGVHDVYASPGAAESYKKTGQWPDGAVLVKDISAIKSGRMTTGDAHWAGDTGVWFVMVKDRKGRFPDNKIWAKGWGWALYKADAPSKNVNENWSEGGLSNCRGCHTPAKKTDWVFVEGYPTLRKN